MLILMHSISFFSWFVVDEFIAKGESMIIKGEIEIPSDQFLGLIVMSH
jgi:hypothetical protein